MPKNENLTYPKNIDDMLEIIKVGIGEYMALFETEIQSVATVSYDSVQMEDYILVKTENGKEFQILVEIKN